jgi:PAS domain S-box-containing protein
VSAIEAIGDVEEALEGLNVPSYILDDHGIIRWVNSAGMRLVGDVRGKQFTSVVSPEEKSRAQDAYAQKIAGTIKTTDAEVVLLDKDGDRVSVELSSVRLQRGGRVVGVFGQLTEVHGTAPAVPHPHLTPRQAEVLRMLEHGRSTGQIADDLSLSKETVRNHIRHMFQTLGVHSRLEAVALARHHASSVP